jgi:hypothetical protein
MAAQRRMRPSFDMPAKSMRRALDRLEEMSGYIERGAFSALRLPTPLSTDQT